MYKAYTTKQVSVYAITLGALLALAFFSSAFFALAEETTVDASASVTATTTRPILHPRTPGENAGIRAEAMEKRMDIRASTTEALKALNDERKAALEKIRAVVASSTAAWRKRFASSTSANLKDRRDLLRTTIQQRKDETKQFIEQKLSLLQENTQARIGAMVDATSQRLNREANRLSTIADRLDSRISKMDTANMSTDKAKQLLADARIKIKTAQDDLTLVATVKANVLASDTPKERFGEIRDAVGVVKDDLKAAKKALQDVVAEIKTQYKNTPNAGGDDTASDSTSSESTSTDTSASATATTSVE